jgi:hypothetical protein
MLVMFASSWRSPAAGVRSFKRSTWAPLSSTASLATDEITPDECVGQL